MKELPLAGLVIADFTRQMAGPYASMVLADFGADVIKIESYPDGDPSRRTGTFFVEGESTLFLTWNRNKRSLCLDLRRPEGVDVARRLIAKADVVMENYRPGVADAIGIGWNSARTLNPGIIYCSVTAFGTEGPWRDLPGTDPVAQAMSGVMSVTGEPDGGPILVGIPIGDYTGALMAVQAVLLALQERSRTGEGQRVEVSLLGALLFGLTTRVGPYFLTGENPQRWGSAHSQVVPYQAFRTADGHAVAGVWGDEGWPAFCEAIGLADLADDPSYRTNVDRVRRREELTDLLQGEFEKRPTAEWEERFRESGVLFARVNAFSDILESEQVKVNGLVEEVAHPRLGRLRQIAPAIRFPDRERPPLLPPPSLGQHSAEVLNELGYTRQDIDRLTKSHVVRADSSDPGAGTSEVEK